MTRLDEHFHDGVPAMNDRDRRAALEADRIIARSWAKDRADLARLRKAAQEVLAADGAIAREEPGADHRWDVALAELDAALEAEG